MKALLWAVIMGAITAGLMLAGWKAGLPWLFLPALLTGPATVFPPLSWRNDEAG